MKIKSGLVSLLPLLFLVSPALLGQPTPEVPKPLLFTLLPNVQIPPPRGKSIKREMAVEVNLNNLDLARNSTKLLFPLFPRPGTPTPPLNLTLTRRTVDRDGTVIRTGIVNGQPASVVTMAVSKNVLIANVTTQITKERRPDYYEIRYLRGGQAVLRLVDPNELPPEGEPIPPEEEDMSPDGPCSTNPADPANMIDVLVVYTPQAALASGGQVQIEDQIKMYIEDANTSYENSGITQRLRRVGMREVQYQESTEPKKDLKSLRRGEKGLDEVHTIRDAVGADLVALIVEYAEDETDSCGESYNMVKASTDFENRAFSVVLRDCADEKYTLIHELGHLMGARHDWYEDTLRKWRNHPWPYSHGYVHASPTSVAPAFRTIMATTLKCDDQKQKCDRILYWSNTDDRITYPGTGMHLGVAPGTAQPGEPDEPSDNAKTLNNTAPSVANFRCRKN